MCEIARKWVDTLDFKIVTKWESKKPRCHYCNEPGHFMRECQKRSHNEGGLQHFSGLNSEYYDDEYDYDDDYEDYEEEYEEDVFASLNA